jgi:bacterioferritin-associated ferredoxin
MSNIELLIAIRKVMYGRVVNYGFESVLTEKQWREFVYKCVCGGVTEEQIDELVKLGVDRQKVYDILNVGKDCGTCVRDECKDCPIKEECCKYKGNEDGID